MFEKKIKNKFITHEYFELSAWLIPLALAALLVISSFSSFLLFHTLAEMFAIIIAVLMCVVAWQMYPFTKNNFLMYLGTGYFWIACLDLVHALSYKGINIIPNSDADTSIQFWIITRYFEALLLVSAPWFLNHNLQRKKFLTAFGIGAVTVIYIILFTDIFPQAYVEGKGLTPFKVISEYIIITILILAIVYLKKHEDLLEKNIVNIMVISITLTMFAELAFTFYVDVYGLSNLVGHLFKMFSFWLIFMAMVKTTLKEPFLVMSRGASTYDAIPDATIVVDENGIIREANNAAHQLAKTKCEDLIGKNNHELFHPENIEIENCRICQGIVNNEEIRGIEFQVDEAGNWFDYSLSHITGASNLNGTVEVIRDITQRKLNEDKISELNILKNSIVENLPNMLFVKDANDHRYIEWNKAAEELTGMLKDEMLDKNDFYFWPKEQAEFFIGKDKEVIASKTLFDIAEEPITTKYKGTRTLHTKKIPIYDAFGKAKYLLGISEDITERLKIESMLNRSQKMEAVGQMSGGIAHDFNNQMGVILGYADLLEDQNLTEDQLSWVKTVKVAARRCADLTQQLLAFSRNGEIDKEVTGLNEMLSEMEVMIERSLTPEVKIEYFMNDDLWDIEVNRGACKDAILNIILNARDAMPDGGTLTIETTNISFNDDDVSALPNLHKGEYVQLMIHDSGKGMSQEIYEHVFEPFFTTKDVGKGTGLGLSMVYGFVQRYAGDISLETEQGEGTTFRVYLPRSKDDNRDKEITASEDKVFAKGHETILIVDDEEALLTFAKHILKNWGYEVYIAKNAAEALKILENSSVDLLFTDVVMPGKFNGYALAEKALQLYPDLKVLITSGFAEKFGNNDQYAKHEFNFIKKPYKRKDLSEKLRQLFDE